MEWKQQHTHLNKILAGIIPFKKEAYQIAVKTGLNVSQISFDDKPSNNWFAIIQSAILEDKVLPLIDQIIEEYGTIPILQTARKGEIDTILLDPADEPPIVWDHNEADSHFQFEKIIGRESTLLPIHFLEKGLKVAKSVGKVVTPRGSGTGFLTHDNVLITNNHVLPTIQMCKESHVLFNFQKNASGLDLGFEKVSFSPNELFHTSVDDDWSAVRVQGELNKSWGALTMGDVEIVKNQRVSIIQHPGGGHKQIALHHNYIRHFDERIVQYLTDTMPGSSGSPVFNENWQIVALHHAGGYLREPSTKRMVFRNQGIRIGRIHY